MKRLSLLLAGIAAIAATPAAAQTVAITGGRVVIGDGSEPIDGGTVVIRDGRVLAAGANVAVPAGAQVVDARGKWVTPGVVAGFSRIGLVEVDAVDATNDVQAANSPFNAAIDVAPAVNPEATAVQVSRAAGVTRAVVSPGTARSIFGGQGAVIDLAGDMQPITRARLFQYVELGEEGAGDAGGSRASAHVLLRNALREARELSRPAGRPDDVLLTRADATALVEVLAGRQLLLVHVERASDILQVLALRGEFPTLRLVLVGATEGWRVAREIAAARVPVIANALNDLPASFEQLSATQSNVGRMRAAGINVAIGMINDDEARQVRLSTQYAGNLVALTRIPGATGLSWSQAFEAISSAPAEALGLGGEIGSLRPGRRGDVVIWDGDPLELSTGVDAVWIDGVRQSLENRQTRLRDRYRRPQEGALPHSYSPR
ncbi:MAG TPA: amidohydrolase family protein [Allosphingosinicella sp.]|nr:amidohydrolase family protein [Allosphingosinicella sp.]